MCGLAAIHGLMSNPPSSRTLKNAMASISHRGSDGEGQVVTAHGALLHRRLAIRDIEQGEQPMWDKSKRYCLIYNGEIYNHSELMSALTKTHGVVFHTHCDTEVLLQGLIVEGVNFLHKVNGMFSFAFYDREKETMLAGRDRFGIKPLFYGKHNGRVAFGSEIDAVTDLLPALKRDWDHTGLDHYFTLGYIPPPRTHLTHVKHVQPGHIMIVDGLGNVASCQYTDITSRINSDGPIIKKDEGIHLLKRAVKSQCVSDVPVGTFLSGGIDSSVVSRIAHDHIPSDLNTFTAGFRNEHYNEASRAASFAKSLGVNHHITWLDEDSMKGHGVVAKIYDSPFSDNAAYPTYLVAKDASKHVKVMLSGDGADELFFGYRNHRAMHFETNLKNKIPAFFRQHVIAVLAKHYPNHPSMPRYMRAKSTLQALSHPLAKSYCWAMSQMTPERLDGMYTDEFKCRTEGERADDWFQNLANSANSDEPMKIIQHLDFTTYLPGCILTKLDRATMRAGVEARVPFLDNTLADRLLSQPHHLNMDSVAHKRQLREWCKGFLPAETSMRVKKSFTSPLDEWFRSLQKPLFYGMLLSDDLLDSGIFSPDALIKTLDDHYEGRTNDGPFLWSLSVFNRFLNKSKSELIL